MPSCTMASAYRRSITTGDTDPMTSSSSNTAMNSAPMVFRLTSGSSQDSTTAGKRGLDHERIIFILKKLGAAGRVEGPQRPGRGLSDLGSSVSSTPHARNSAFSKGHWGVRLSETTRPGVVLLPGHGHRAGLIVVRSEPNDLSYFRPEFT